MSNDSTIAERLLSAKGRVALYALGFAILGLLGLYGVLTTEQQAAWGAVLLAALSVATLVFTHITPDDIPATSVEVAEVAKEDIG